MTTMTTAPLPSARIPGVQTLVAASEALRRTASTETRPARPALETCGGCGTTRQIACPGRVPCAGCAPEVAVATAA
ncbi:hypothetical protein [Salinarimonas ramus]|uniref:Uncharacterized protein n=1 Tax=Salinarimonas ramus TaxID=690164 RepID=A0A917Q9V7_9HYPH|nr:hypothetical protein [Salinarimonas ramus]GGK37900.1 hypothetical protein GCM10011322_26180 [Salinarimonas ramus]